jgi:hypothetical protein
MPSDLSSLPPFPDDRAGTPSPQPSSWRGKLLVVGGVVTVVLIVTLAVLPRGRSRSASGDASPSSPNSNRFAGVPAYAINLPRLLPADQAKLEDRVQVIGVTVKGKPRAYLLSALGGQPMVHVVNDLIGDVPVSLAYCDRTKCITVFTGPAHGALLALAFGGFDPDGMLIRAAGDTYFQHTLNPVENGARPFPYTPLQFEQTTWQEWKTAHPDTEVYTGPANVGAGQQPSAPNAISPPGEKMPEKSAGIGNH